MNKLIMFPTSVEPEGRNPPPVRVSGPSESTGVPVHTQRTAEEYLRWPSQQSARQEEKVTPKSRRAAFLHRVFTDLTGHDGRQALLLVHQHEVLQRPWLEEEGVPLLQRHGGGELGFVIVVPQVGDLVKVTNKTATKHVGDEEPNSGFVTQQQTLTGFQTRRTRTKSRSSGRTWRWPRESCQSISAGFLSPGRRNGKA